MSKQLFPRLQAAAIDGRTRNILYRQEQLFKLHKALVQESEAIVNAIASDLTRGEAQVEYALALKELRERYAELDAEKGLEEEYAITNGKDAAGLRTGAGIVLIKAHTDHTLFFSVVAPLSAAIAAGNCVVVQVSGLLQERWNASNPCADRQQSPQPSQTSQEYPQGGTRFGHFRCVSAAHIRSSIPGSMPASSAGL